jgi:hypothetical protein
MTITPFIPVTREKATEVLSVSLATIDNWISSGVLPPTTTIGKRLEYWHPDTFYGCLDALLRGNKATITPSEDAALIAQVELPRNPVAKKASSKPIGSAVFGVRARDAANRTKLLE